MSQHWGGEGEKTNQHFSENVRSVICGKFHCLRFLGALLHGYSELFVVWRFDVWFYPNELVVWPLYDNR